MVGTNNCGTLIPVHFTELKRAVTIAEQNTTQQQQQKTLNETSGLSKQANRNNFPRIQAKGQIQEKKMINLQTYWDWEFPYNNNDEEDNTTFIAFYELKKSLNVMN